MKRFFCSFGCLLIAAVALVATLPREGRVALDYEQGRPWKYAPLIATFDFPIARTEAELRTKRAQVERNFQPYFHHDTLVGRRQVAALARDVAAGQGGGLTPAAVQHVSQLLRRVYEDGIIDATQLDTLRHHGHSALRVVEGTEAKARPLGSFYTTRAAYAYIMAADTLAFPRDVLARLDLGKYLTPDLTYDEQKSREGLESALQDSITANAGMVLAGQRIVDRGEIVTAAQAQMIASYVKETDKHAVSRTAYWSKLGGQALLVLLVLAIFGFYLHAYRPAYARDLHTVSLFYFLIALFPLLTYVMVRQNYFSVYILPYAMVPFFVRTFFDARTASVALIVSMLLASFGVRGQYEFLTLEVFMGLIAIYALREMTERSQIIRVAACVAVSGLVFQFAADVAQGLAPRDLDHSRYAYIAASGIALLFAYPLMYLVERVFGFTSSVTLVELSNTNTPLLRRMARVAPGTLQHSLQVGNLAAEVAAQVGASPQLARTAGLYHDIGKMLNPAFFTENQSGHNPHDDLQEKDGISPEQQSAQIIISHVTEGLRLADKYHLPRLLRDFIATHHGRSKVKYFYVQWKNRHPGQQPDEAAFTYPGPEPSTKEQAILMMCDAVEASSRSLKEFSTETITALVDKIVDGQVAEGHFRDCPITFRDIQTAKHVLVEALKTTYHTRIAYPELKPQAPARPHTPRRHLLSGSFYRKP